VTLSESHFSFLQSYIKVMTPLVIAMDILQSEKSYIGHLVSTIIGLQRKNVCSFRHLPLAAAIANGLDARFGSVLESLEYNLAASLVPQFKLHFLPDDKKPEMKRKMLAFIDSVYTMITMLQVFLSHFRSRIG